MTRRRIQAVTALRAMALALALATIAPELEAQKGKPLSEVPMLLSFGTGEANALRSDGHLAPGDAADYAHGVENVQAVLYPAGNLGFSTQANGRQAAERAVCFDFGSQQVPFAAGQCVNIAQPMIAYLTETTPIHNLAYGQSVPKLTRFAWTDASTNTLYRLGYGTDMDGNGQLDSPPVRVTCILPIDAAAGQCSTWTVAPEADGTAALFSFAQTIRGGKVTVGPAVLVAHYVMPFVQTITRQ